VRNTTAQRATVRHGQATVSPYVLAVLLLGSGALFGTTWAVVGKRSTGIDREAFTALATTQGSLLAHFVKLLSVIAPPLVAAVKLIGAPGFEPGTS
jgi:hypothetical protein